MPDYYQHTTYPSTSASLASSPMRGEFDTIAAGFAKIPDYTGNALKIIAVNAGGTALEAAAVTGTGSVVRATGATLVSPALGAATATSLNGATFTTSSGTWTLTNGKTFTCTNSLTLVGTDGSTLNIGTGGTLGSGAYATVTGTNTGDETTATIKTKLSITTLSGSNTGDQTTVTGSSGSCTGNAATATSTPKLLTTNFTCEEVSGVLKFKYGATVIATLNSSGDFKTLANNGGYQAIT